jgi:hypothetical protein
MAESSQILKDAYQLIEDGDFQAARELLERHREENENNPDFWWVYAHAVETNEEGQEALQRLLELDPDYPGARTLLSQVAPPPIEPTSMSAAPLQPPGDDSFTDEDFADFTEDDFAATGTEGRSALPRNLLFGAGAIVILLLLGVLLLPSLLGGTPDATPTNTIAEQPTARPLVDDLTEAVIVPTEDFEETEIAEEETETPPLFATDTEVTEVDETEEVDELPVTEVAEEETEDVDAQGAEATPTRETSLPTETPTSPPATETATTPTEDASYGLDPAVLEAARVPADGVNLEETTLGNTLVFTVCAPPGPQASNAIAEILDLLLDETSDLPDEIVAYGFGITDCDTDSVFRTIGISRDDFEASDSSEEIQGALRPIN